MNIEIYIIRVLLQRELYIKYRKYVVLSKDSSRDLVSLYQLLDSMQDELQRDITLNEFCLHVEQKQLGDMLTALQDASVPDDTIETLLEKLVAKQWAYEHACLAVEVHEGKKDIDALLEHASESPVKGALIKNPWVTTDVREIQKSVDRSAGLKWRLPSLQNALGGLMQGDFGFVFARPECFAKGTKVLLHTGRAIEIEKIIPGMKVMGPDSQPRHVIATSHGFEKMYRVSYPWGDSYVCNESHVLQLRAEGNTITQVKVRDYLNWSDKLKCRFKQYKVGIELPYVDVKLDPYVLGLWLGDGTSAKPAFTNADTEVITYLQSWADSMGLICNVFERERQGLAKTITISSKTKKHGANTFLQFLKSRRLLRNKHIPINYLRNSREVRLQLLAGLIDTDGWKERSSYGFCNKNEKLCEEVVWLARSLGFHATMRPKIVNEETYYTLGIYGNCSEIPVRIGRKRIPVQTVKPKRNGLNFGFTIVEEPSVNEYYGIQVDKDSLYLLNDFTVVHNTGKTTFLASQVTYFAAQSTAPVIWANNEERGEKVQSRLIQSALQMDRDRFLSLDADLISTEYQKRTKGNLKLGDYARLHRSDIERICEEMHPAILVIDQIDKVKGFKADKRETMLGELYQWTREMAKEYCPIIGVCQASATAEGKKWLTMDDVAESKTTKAAEADFIIGVGKTHDEGQEDVRYLHIIKNKLTGNHARITCRIRADIGRYEDL